MSKKPPIKVDCPYCGNPAVLTDSAEVYRQSYGMIWICRPCKAWVGCHKKSKRNAPLGRLANASLRAAKTRAHASFDPLWKRKAANTGMSHTRARQMAYAWLARKMGLTTFEAHIGKFDEAQCANVVELCAPYAVS